MAIKNLEISINGKQIKRDDSSKYLGVTFDGILVYYAFSEYFKFNQNQIEEVNNRYLKLYLLL